jgi:hypothetical protein
LLERLQTGDGFLLAVVSVHFEMRCADANPGLARLQCACAEKQYA